MIEAQLRKIMPRSNHLARLYLPHLNAAMAEFDINTTARITAFLGQIAHESQELQRVEENLNYSADRLLQVWPTRFPSRNIANQYARQPMKLANYVYADRMGNGPPESGDGWRHRGVGLIMRTGKAEHQKVADYFKIALDQIGDWMRTPEGAARSAAHFWRGKDLNPLADGGQYVLITKRINGGILGLADRQGYYMTAREVFA